MEQAIAIGEKFSIRPASVLGGRQDLCVIQNPSNDTLVLHLGAMREVETYSGTNLIIPVLFEPGYVMEIKIQSQGGVLGPFLKALSNEGLLPLAWSNWHEPIRRAIEASGGDHALEKELAGLFRACKWMVFWGEVTEITRKIIRRIFP